MAAFVANVVSVRGFVAVNEGSLFLPLATDSAHVTVENLDGRISRVVVQALLKSITSSASAQGSSDYASLQV